MIILKIGGSVITDKTKGVFNKAKLEMIEFVVKAIAENLSDSLVLVHGVGSFGHPYVEKYKLKEEKNLEGVIRAHLSCKELNTTLCKKMLEYGLKPYPIHPFISFKVIDSKLVFDKDLIENALREGFIPVLHGDMVYNVNENKFEVLSGDNIVVELAKYFEADRIGFATDVDGVIIDGHVAKIITSKDVDKIGYAENKSDVTGGMRDKVLKVLKAKIKAYIFNARDLSRFLRGEEVGTLISF